MDDRHDDAIDEAAGRLGPTAPLGEVRADLGDLEAVEDEARLRAAELRAILPAAHHRRIWALQDAEQRLGLAERLLAERHLVEALARRVPEHAAAIRAIARQCLEDVAAGELA